MAAFTLKKKGNDKSKRSKLTEEIATALKEVKDMQTGKTKPLSLKDLFS